MFFLIVVRFIGGRVIVRNVGLNVVGVIVVRGWSGRVSVVGGWSRGFVGHVTIFDALVPLRYRDFPGFDPDHRGRSRGRIRVGP